MEEPVLMKDKILYMIGNAHIDPVWLWRWHEGFHEVLATFRSALDRLNEDEAFVFTASSAAFYDWVEQQDPAMFAEIQARVAEGRWGLVGGWWIEPDCNVPGGESFVRQALYGQRYFQAKFGQIARVGYNPDSFGHNATLPQILKKSGCDFYVFMRPGPHEKELPGHLFWWKADDGSRVLVYRIPYSYATWGENVAPHVQRCAELLSTVDTPLMGFYGVGNHGGGPTLENLATLHALNEDPAFPRLVFSTPEQFFDAITAAEAIFPTVHDELQHHASGCYAAHSGIKRWNRRAEHALLAAEAWAAVAHWVTGRPYPAADLEHAWKNTLFNQFHDILAGTSLEVAYEDARRRHGETMSLADRAHNAAVQSLAWQIHIPPKAGMIPIVVFNPHAWEQQTPVEVEFWKLDEDDYILLDDAGMQVPAQWIPAQATTRSARRLCFVATLPALGYRTYRLVPSNRAPILMAQTRSLSVMPPVLENEHLRIEFDSPTGSIARMVDKRAGVKVFSGLAARAIVIEDFSDTWSHGVFQFTEEISAFYKSRFQLLESGPVRSVVRVITEYGASQLIQTFTLYTALPYVEVQVMVDWHEQFKLLKLRFAVNVAHPEATHEIPYGHIARPPTGEEEASQRWVDVSGVTGDGEIPYGLSLLNDGKYSFDVHDNVLSMTVVRSPIYAHHVPYEPDPDGTYTFMDQGIQHFRYALLPHTSSWIAADTVQHAIALNHPPFALAATYHPEGTLPQSASFLTVEPAMILVSVVKQAEEGDALILRAYEIARQETEAVIRLPQWGPHGGREISAHFGPCEIKTFRIPKDHAQPVTETNLLEGM
ncbi:MAG: alpha-mannosidase [Anaerolineae bacterium]|nr:alpha-mannosidase [Anaerolineae bacterium]